MKKPHKKSKDEEELDFDEGMIDEDDDDRGW